jgi:hypothetical protein
MKRLTLLLVMIASVAFGQSDTTQLNTFINANFPDNVSGFITPARLRAVSQELMRSCANLKEVNTFEKWAVFEDAVTVEDSIKSDVGFYEWDGAIYKKLTPCTQCVLTAKLVIPSAEVLQLFTTPKAFGLTVPAGHFVQPISVSFVTTNTTTAYDTNVIFAVRYVGGGANISITGSNWARVLTGTVNRGGVLGIDNGMSGTTTETQLIAGADLEALVMNGNPLNGDSDITLYLTYMLIEL